MNAQSTQSQPPTVATKWLCRLGPWSWPGEVTPQTMPDIMDWAQEKTGHYLDWNTDFRDELAVLFAHRLNVAKINNRGWMELQFGYMMHVCPEKPKISLPMFYPGPAFGLSWKAAYSEKSADGWDVCLKLCTGGVWKSAILATEEQASDFVRTLMYGAAQYGGPKD